MKLPPLSVYDGQTHIGSLDDRGRDGVVAYALNAAGKLRKIGTYETRTAGMRAISGKAAVPPVASGGRAR